MLGAILAFIVIMIMLFMVYHAASICHEGKGGVLCKLWNWIA